jgi:tetratricopeptide (TPR) repeat protein
MEVLQKCDTRDRRGAGQARNNFGVVHRNRGEFHDAIDCFEEDLAICRRGKDRYGEAQSLGNAYAEMSRFDEAVACYQDALAIFRETGDSHDAGQILGNLAIAHLRRGRIDQALSCWLDAARAMREAGELKTAIRYENFASTVPARRWWRRR